MAKLYFCSNDYDEACYSLDYFQEQLGNGLTELIIYPAKMVTDSEYFYCAEFQEVGEVGEGCGKMCDKYEPRNGKNGRCRHARNCYEPIMDKPITLSLNELTSKT